MPAFSAAQKWAKTPQNGAASFQQWEMVVRAWFRQHVSKNWQTWMLRNDLKLGAAKTSDQGFQESETASTFSPHWLLYHYSIVTGQRFRHQRSSLLCNWLQAEQKQKNTTEASSENQTHWRHNLSVASDSPSEPCSVPRRVTSDVRAGTFWLIRTWERSDMSIQSIVTLSKAKDCIASELKQSAANLAEEKKTAFKSSPESCVLFECDHWFFPT